MEKGSVAKGYLSVVMFAAGLVLGGCRTRGKQAEVTTPATALFEVSKNKKSGFINKQGQVVIELQFDTVREFTEGLAAICVGPCKFVETGESVPDTRVDLKEQAFQGKWGFIDANGKMVINPRFTFAGEFHEGLAYAATGEYKLFSKMPLQYGYIDRSGAFVVPEQFQSPQDFNDSGLAGACVGAGDSPRCGFIDTSGRFVINPQFYSVNAFQNGLAKVFESNKATGSYISRIGRVVWKGEEQADNSSFPDK